MPIEKDSKLVKLKPMVFERLSKQFQSGTRPAPDFTNFLNDLLMDIIEKNEFLQIYAPSLLNYGIHANVLLIKDEKIDRIAEIGLTKDVLHCSVDHSTDCIHIKYALALPEIARLRS